MKKFARNKKKKKQAKENEKSVVCCLWYYEQLWRSRKPVKWHDWRWKQRHGLDSIFDFLKPFLLIRLELRLYAWILSCDKWSTTLLVGDENSELEVVVRVWKDQRRLCLNDVFWLLPMWRLTAKFIENLWKFIHKPNLTHSKFPLGLSFPVFRVSIHRKAFFQFFSFLLCVFNFHRAEKKIFIDK